MSYRKRAPCGFYCTYLHQPLCLAAWTCPTLNPLDPAAEPSIYASCLFCSAARSLDDHYLTSSSYSAPIAVSRCIDSLSLRPTDRPTTAMAIRGPSPSPTLQLLASRAFSSTIPLARHATARVARVVNRPSPVGRCYNRPVVRPNHGGLTAPNRPRNVPSSGPGRPKAHSGSQRKYSTQGADGTYYSTGGTSYGYVPPESYTMSDILFSTFLKGRRAQGKGREGKKKKKARLPRSPLLIRVSVFDLQTAV